MLTDHINIRSNNISKKVRNKNLKSKNKWQKQRQITLVKTS